MVKTKCFSVNNYGRSEERTCISKEECLKEVNAFITNKNISKDDILEFHSHLKLGNDVLHPWHTYEIRLSWWNESDADEEDDETKSPEIGIHVTKAQFDISVKYFCAIAADVMGDGAMTHCFAIAPTLNRCLAAIGMSKDQFHLVERENADGTNYTRQWYSKDDSVVIHEVPLH